MSSLQQRRVWLDFFRSPRPIPADPSQEPPIRIIRRARELLARGWTQGPLATDKNGQAVDLSSRTAACFCASGACARAIYEDMGTADIVQFLLIHRRALRYLGAVAPGGSVINYNEQPGRTQAHVLAVFDKAIEKAEIDHLLTEGASA